MKLEMAHTNRLIHLGAHTPCGTSSTKGEKPGQKCTKPNALAAAVNEDFRQIRRELVKAIQRICPPWLSSRADDLIQASLMRLLDLHRRNPNRHFNNSYLWKTAYSALVDEIRKSRRQETVFAEEKDVQDALDEAPGPHGLFASQEIGAGIRDSLLELSEERRAAVTLYLQGYNVPEASRLLNWSRKKTENMVYRGLKELRQNLVLKGFQP